jgi:hypothetical protein
MARLFTTGAEERTMEVWDDWYYAAHVSTAVARSGVASFWTDFSYANIKNVGTLQEVYVRAAVYSASSDLGNLPYIEAHYNYSNNSIIRAHANSIWIEGTTVASNSTLYLNHRWYLMEVHFKLGTSNGVVEVKMDGNLVLQYTGNTNPNNRTGILRIAFTNKANVTYWDDIAINDTSGSEDNSWCGDGRIVLLKPNANGDTNQWTPSSGNNYECVDEGFPANDDTDYVTTDTTNQKDLYNLENWSLPSNSIIKRVWAIARAKKTSSDLASINIGLKTNSQEYWMASDTPLITTYKNYYGNQYTKNPATSNDWTIDDINNLQVGIMSK